MALKVEPRDRLRGHPLSGSLRCAEEGMSGEKANSQLLEARRLRRQGPLRARESLAGDCRIEAPANQASEAARGMNALKSAVWFQHCLTSSTAQHLNSGQSASH